MKNINPILRRAVRNIFHRRENFPVKYLTDIRVETVNNAACCDVWFLTCGCSHDKKGGCTMCNYGYGKGFIVDDDAIINSIRKEISALPEDIEEITLSPSGSIFDEAEVPRELRRRILEMLGRIKCRKFFAESRCDSLTDENLEELKQYITADKIYIETGIESCNDWILKNSINKNLSVYEIQRTICLVHKHAIGLSANMAIGFPFVNEHTGIILAAHSIKKVLRMGADNVVFFPYHVRPGTFLELLWDNNLYKPCSLYSFCEVLRMLDEDLLPLVNISWYRNYYGKDSGKILASPSACPECEERILSVLDIYKNKPCIESLGKLDEIKCECFGKWRSNIMMQPIELDIQLLKRALDTYRNNFSRR